MNGGFERKSRGDGKKWRVRGGKTTSVVQQEMEATDSIVFRPTSRRREINRAVCIHRRIFQRLSLQDGDDDEERYDCSYVIDALLVRTSASLRATARVAIVFHSLNCFGYCIVSTYSPCVSQLRICRCTYRRENRDFNESRAQNNIAFYKE